MLGGWAAGDLLGVREGASFHLCQDAFLVELGFQKAGIAIKLHQVENLRSKHHAAQSQKEQSSLLLGTHEQCYFGRVYFSQSSQGILMLTLQASFCSQQPGPSVTLVGVESQSLC